MLLKRLMRSISRRMPSYFCGAKRLSRFPARLAASRVLVVCALSMMGAGFGASGLLSLKSAVSSFVKDDGRSPDSIASPAISASAHWLFSLGHSFWMGTSGSLPFTLMSYLRSSASAGSWAVRAKYIVAHRP